MKLITKEVIDKLTVEYDELADRIRSLERFLICEDFQQVMPSQRLLLAQQRTAMEQYKEILLKRLVDLRNQEKEEKEMSCGVPAENEDIDSRENIPGDINGTPAD